LQSCEIVSLDWLLDSDKAKKPVSEAPYRFGASHSNRNSQADPVKTEKKRSAKAVQDTDDDRPNKKPKQIVEDAQMITAEKAAKVKVGVDEDYYSNEPTWQGEQPIA
jgi:poly [ADP-ribose] polymerase